MNMNYIERSFVLHQYHLGNITFDTFGNLEMEKTRNISYHPKDPMFPIITIIEI